MADREFAKRLTIACDGYDLAPAYGRGRQTWLSEQLNVSNEAVRKWFSGESRPRPKKMAALAELLKVDEAWLALGVPTVLTAEGKRTRSIKLNGAANIFMGFLQVNEGSVAFPDPDDPGSEYVDFYTILKGQHLAFHITLATKKPGGKLSFVVPNEFERCTVIGAVQREPLHIDFLQLNVTTIKQRGTRHGGHIELEVESNGDRYVTDGEKVKRLQDFDHISG